MAPVTGTGGNMNFWYLIVSVALATFAVWLKTNDLMGTLAALVFGAAFSAAAIFFFLRGKKESNLTVAASAVFFSFATAGLSAPLFAGLPVYLPWILFTGFVALFSLATAYFAKPAKVATVMHETTASDEDRISTNKKKVLDTSIVIDGRFNDIAQTGFVEGPFIIPNFVLREIQLISDSSDPIKRNRGRRGLDMLNQLQKSEEVHVSISYKDYTETREVDAKLVRLAKDLDAHLITNDFNLNKVAELQGVKVLNINNLANALKPVVIVGEELELQVVKEGKDDNQGIGYLEDGTMVVIESGGKLLGKKVRVNVTSVIQTNAGKMIFTKLGSQKNG